MSQGKLFWGIISIFFLLSCSNKGVNIELIGDVEEYYFLDEAYVEKGVQAFAGGDAVDAEITGTVNTSRVGLYIVSYGVEYLGVHSEKTRRVYVSAKVDSLYGVWVSAYGTCSGFGFRDTIVIVGLLNQPGYGNFYDAQMIEPIYDGYNQSIVFWQDQMLFEEDQWHYNGDIRKRIQGEGIVIGRGDSILFNCKYSTFNSVTLVSESDSCEVLLVKN
jgi:hypothetical protein